MGDVHYCCVLYLTHDLYVNRRIKAEDRETQLGMLHAVPDWLRHLLVLGSRSGFPNLFPILRSGPAW
jgi:hypothetical protein